MNPALSVTSRLALLGACALLMSCAHGPTLGKVTDVVITSRLNYEYDDPEFLPCRNFNPSVRDISRFLTTAILMEPGETEAGDSEEPCSVSGKAKISGAEASWRLNMFGVGAAIFYSPYEYQPLAVVGKRGVDRARSRLLSLFGPDHFTPAPRQEVNLDARVRDYALWAGLQAVQEGEVRVWWSSVQSHGVSTLDGELIEHLFAYRVDAANEKHGRTVWKRSRLSPEATEAVRKASADVVDLNGMQLKCSQVYLDGYTVLIEAMVDGTRVILAAEDPDERDVDACGRVWVLEQLLRNAINRRQ